HLTMGPHIDRTVNTARGILVNLRKSATKLNEKLLKLAYIAIMIRSRLKYCNSVLDMASATQKNKLEKAQKASIRAIKNVPKYASSEPLRKHLKLQTLESRRISYMKRLTNRIIQGNIHPALKYEVQVNIHPRTTYGKRQFILGSVN